MASANIPKTETMIHGEFCPVSNGRPNKINTAPNPQNSFHIAALYPLKSVTWKVFIFAQKPIGLFEKKEYTPSPIIKHPTMLHKINPNIAPVISVSFPSLIWYADSFLNPLFVTFGV